MLLDVLWEKLSEHGEGWALAVTTQRGAVMGVFGVISVCGPSKYRPVLAPRDLKVLTAEATIEAEAHYLLRGRPPHRRQPRRVERATVKVGTGVGVR